MPTHFHEKRLFSRSEGIRFINRTIGTAVCDAAKSTVNWKTDCNGRSLWKTAAIRLSSCEHLRLYIVSAEDPTSTPFSQG